MEPIESFKQLGILSVVVLTAGLVFVAKKWPVGLDKTFSQHVARSRKGIIFYASLFTVVLPLLLLFLLGWFVPTYSLSVWFSSAIVAAAVTQYVCTLIPEVGGWKTKYHTILALASAQLLVIPVLVLVLSQTLNAVSRFVAGFVLFAMIGIELAVYLSKSKHKYMLLLQAGYFLLFFIAILFVTYFN